MDTRLFWQVGKDAITEGLLICDRHFQILDINRNLEVMLELTDWRGKSIIEVFPQKVKEKLNQVLKDLESIGACLFPKRFDFITSKGVILPLMVSGEILMGEEGERVGYLFVFKDTIMQEEVATFSWLSHLREVFLSSLTKELYLPLHNLSRILGDLLDFYSLDSEGKRLLESSIEELDKIRKIYAKLLDHTRIDLVKDRICLKRIKISDVINRSLMLVDSAGKMRIDFQGQDEVMTDEFKIEQFFVLLLDKTSSEEGVKIRISSAEKDVDVEILGQGDWWKGLEERVPFAELQNPQDELRWNIGSDLDKNLIYWIGKRLKIRVRLEDVKEGKRIRISIPREL